MENGKHQNNKSKNTGNMPIKSKRKYVFSNLQQKHLTCIDKVKEITIHAKLLYRSDIKCCPYQFERKLQRFMTLRYAIKITKNVF